MYMYSIFTHCKPKTNAEYKGKKRIDSNKMNDNKFGENKYGESFKPVDDLKKNSAQIDLNSTFEDKHDWNNLGAYECLVDCATQIPSTQVGKMILKVAPFVYSMNMHTLRRQLPEKYGFLLIFLSLDLSLEQINYIFREFIVRMIVQQLIYKNISIDNIDRNIVLNTIKQLSRNHVINTRLNSLLGMLFLTYLDKDSILCKFAITNMKDFIFIFTKLLNLILFNSNGYLKYELLNYFKSKSIKIIKCKKIVEFIEEVLSMYQTIYTKIIVPENKKCNMEMFLPRYILLMIWFLRTFMNSCKNAYDPNSIDKQTQRPEIDAVAKDVNNINDVLSHMSSTISRLKDNAVKFDNEISQNMHFGRYTINDMQKTQDMTFMNVKQLVSILISISILKSIELKSEISLRNMVRNNFLNIFYGVAMIKNCLFMDSAISIDLLQNADLKEVLSEMNFVNIPIFITFLDKKELLKCLEDLKIIQGGEFVSKKWKKFITREGNEFELFLHFLRRLNVCARVFYTLTEDQMNEFIKYVFNDKTNKQFILFLRTLLKIDTPA